MIRWAKERIDQSASVRVLIYIIGIIFTAGIILGRSNAQEDRIFSAQAAIWQEIRTLQAEIKRLDQSMGAVAVQAAALDATIRAGASRDAEFRSEIRRRLEGNGLRDRR